MNRRNRDIFLRGILILLLFYLMGCSAIEKLANNAPVIHEIIPESSLVTVGDTIRIKVEATDPDENELSYSWEASGGYFLSNQGQTVSWVAPREEAIYTIEVLVRDINGAETRGKITITVTSLSKPSVRILEPRDGAYLTGLGSLEVRVEATPVLFIDRVDFYVDDVLIGTDKTSPYTQSWILDGLSGIKKVKTVAVRTGIPVITSADSVFVSIQGVVVIP